MTDPDRRYCALVPMRHTSERVPGKNYRHLHGRPLFTYVVEALLSVPEIDQVVINTDSVTVKRICAQEFPSVAVVPRPEHLIDGHVPMTEIIKFDVERSSYPWYVQTHSTNPFLKAETVSSALRSFALAGDAHDSLFSVTRLQARLYDAQGVALNHDPDVLLRTQDLPPVFVENSCLYVFQRELALRGARIGERPLMYEIDGREAHDIDTEDDWQLAERLMVER